MINFIKWNKGKIFVLFILIILSLSSVYFINIYNKSKNSLVGIGRASIIDNCTTIECLNNVIDTTNDSDLIRLVNETSSLNKLIINQPENIQSNGGVCRIIGEKVGIRLAKSKGLDNIKDIYNELDYTQNKALENNRYLCQNSVVRGISDYVTRNYDSKEIKNIIPNLCDNPNIINGYYKYIFDPKTYYCPFQFIGSIVSSYYSNNNLSNYSDLIELCNFSGDGNFPICLRGSLVNLIINKEFINIKADDCNNLKNIRYCQLIKGYLSMIIASDKIFKNDGNVDQDLVKIICNDDKDCLNGIYAGTGLLLGIMGCEEKFSYDYENCLRSHITNQSLNALVYSSARGEEMYNKICVDGKIPEIYLFICKEITENIATYNFLDIKK